MTHEVGEHEQHDEQSPFWMRRLPWPEKVASTL